MIDWNNFEFEGCDGPPEQLPDGSRLMICGKGAGVSDDTGKISGSLSGFLLAGIGNSGWRTVCTGVHQFTFTKR